MFGMNTVTGQKFFRESPEAQAGKILVTSMFFTLQGEGPFAGRPAFFIRLAKCQLSCHFCDSYFDSGDWFTPAELYREAGNRIYRYFSDKGGTPEWAAGTTREDSHCVPRRMVLVVTGGEPTLQPNLLNLLEVMKPQFALTQIETNGLIVPDVPFSTTVVCSPKCREDETGKAVAYLKPNSKTLERADCLKFVVRAPLFEGDPYAAVPQWAEDWHENNAYTVYVSPMNAYLREPQRAKAMRAEKAGQPLTLDERSDVDEVVSFWTEGLIDREAAQRNHEYAAALALRHGFTLSMQQHLFVGLA